MAPCSMGWLYMTLGTGDHKSGCGVCSTARGTSARPLAAPVYARAAGAGRAASKTAREDSPSWKESAEKAAARIVRMVLVHLALLISLLSLPSLGLAQCAPCSPLSLSMASQAQTETQEQVTGKV